MTARTAALWQHATPQEKSRWHVSASARQAAAVGVPAEQAAIVQGQGGEERLALCTAALRCT